MCVCVGCDVCYVVLVVDVVWCVCDGCLLYVVLYFDGVFVVVWCVGVVYFVLEFFWFVVFCGCFYGVCDVVVCMGVGLFWL